MAVPIPKQKNNIRKDSNEFIKMRKEMETRVMIAPIKAVFFLPILLIEIPAKGEKIIHAKPETAKIIPLNSGEKTLLIEILIPI